MPKQTKLYSGAEMNRTIRRDREDSEAVELLQSKKFQCRELAKKGYSTALIAKLLHLNERTVLRYLIKMKGA